MTDAADEPRSFAVIPDKPGSLPVVMNLTEQEAQRAMVDRNTRPSTRRGLNSRDSGPGHYVVTSDAAVEATLPDGLDEAKRRLHSRRDQNREAQQRSRDRKRRS